ncbi:MAG: tetratricopeptide repeat protein [bacterium]
MSSPAKPVFISYSTATGGGIASAIQASLGSDLVFRDDSSLQHGRPFPKQLFDALIDARVVICLLDEAFLGSLFCRAELEVALAPLQESGDVADSLGRLVFATPRGSKHAALQALPLALRAIQWPEWGDTETITALVRERLEGPAHFTLRERLPRQRLEDFRGWLNEEAMMAPRRTVPEGRLAVNLPPMPTGRFCGRATELAQLHERLASPQGPSTCAVVAPGGAGKTRLAQEYLWRFCSSHYPGGVIWFNAAAPETRDQQWYDILAQLIPGLPPLPALLLTKLDLAKRLRETLELRAAEGAVLWVVDNLPEPPPGQPPVAIDSWAPVGSAPVAVLVTSRLRQQPAAINFEVGALQRPAAILLLRRDLPPDLLSPDETERIAAAVGDWPLALELLNASFAAQALTPTELLALHEQAGVARLLDDTMELLREQVPEGALRGVSESLLLSYERLAPATQRLACALAHFAAATAIPLDLVEPLPREVWTPSARMALMSRNLLTHPARESIGLLHPLVADFLRAQDTDGAGLAAAWAALGTYIDRHDPAEPSHWTAINRVLPHARAVWGRGGLAPADSVRLGAWLANGLQEQGLFAAAVSQWEPVIEAATAVWGAAHTETLACERRYGDALWMGGRLVEARAALEETLARTIAALGPEHPDTLKTQSNLALALWAMGDLAGARQLDEAVLVAQERVLGPEHPQTLRTRGSLANTFDGLGDLALARELREVALAAQARVLGPEHSDTLVTRGNLASTLKELGDLAGARQLNEGVLAAQERLLGPEHPDALRTRGNLAEILRMQGELRSSKALHDVNQPLLQLLLGADHQLALTFGVERAATLRTIGEKTEAKRLLENLMATCDRVLGPAHPLALTARHELALTLRALGDLPASRDRLAEVLKARQETLPSHYRDRTRAAHDLYGVSRELGEIDVAEDLYRRELAWLVESDEVPQAAVQREIRADLQSARAAFLA